ncbi:MAG: PaaI family thioesterase [Candidatus Aureabacteria bacterium]|nr:PaaI family thioesterase [Candidatus Auribacterota bacterium]
MSSNDFLKKKSAFSDFIGITTQDEGKSFLLKIEEHHLNSHGSAHGGVVFTLADRAFARSVNTAGKTAVAMEMKINYLLPAMKGDVLVARSHVIKEGKRTTVCLIEVTRGEEKVAILLATAFNIRK